MRDDTEQGGIHENCNDKPVQSQPDDACWMDCRRVVADTSDRLSDTDYLKLNLCKGSTCPKLRLGVFVLLP